MTEERYKWYWNQMQAYDVQLNNARNMKERLWCLDKQKKLRTQFTLELQLIAVPWDYEIVTDYNPETRCYRYEFKKNTRHIYKVYRVVHEGQDGNQGITKKLVATFINNDDATNFINSRTDTNGWVCYEKIVEEGTDESIR